MEQYSCLHVRFLRGFVCVCLLLLFRGALLDSHELPKKGRGERKQGNTHPFVFVGVSQPDEYEGTNI